MNWEQAHKFTLSLLQKNTGVKGQSKWAVALALRNPWGLGNVSTFESASSSTLGTFVFDSSSLTQILSKLAIKKVDEKKSAYQQQKKKCVYYHYNIF